MLLAAACAMTLMPAELAFALARWAWSTIR